MYRHRQWPKYSDAELRRIYATPHDHTRWEDHLHRVDSTIAFARRLGCYGRVADLSCGDATIARALSSEPILGDYAPGYEYQGPIEDTIRAIPMVDVFILSETIEHVDDPELVLSLIRQKTRKLILTTPNLTAPDENPEHYWCFDAGAICHLLLDTGFKIIGYEDIYCGMGYRYQAWGCR